ncbi:protein lin-41-like isoform X2 [Rhopilema esculentum]|uniref:protein lin-41-like isoform X2 n=1 Tax=Rhopilema esculentum TaxID=499914 RepID=UPI0031D802AA|eukprot:gene12943-3702_t
MGDMVAFGIKALFVKSAIYISLFRFSNLQELPFPNSFINPEIEAIQHLWDGFSKREIKEFSDIKKPSYVYSLPDHSLFISSFLTDEVLYVKDSRDSSSQVLTFAKGHGLDGPWGIAVDSDFVYIASFTTDQIHKYEKVSGRFISVFGNENELDCPEGMAFGPNKTLYVASFLNDQVVKYTQEGQYLGVVADQSKGLKGPEGVAFLRNGTLLVSSHYTDNVIMLDPVTGIFLGEFAHVEKPVGIITGLDGHVYVTSYVTNSVMRFNGKTGKFIDVFASSDGLRGPSSISFADSRSLYCASYDNDKIILFNSTSGVSLSLYSKELKPRGI